MIKRFLAWAWHWITVIGAVVIGGASFALPILDGLSGMDLSPILPAHTALQIVTTIGVLKWTCVALVAIKDRLS